MSRRTIRRFGEDIGVLVFLIVLFLCLTALVLAMLQGEDRRSRLALQYEAEEVASALLAETLQAGAAPAAQDLGERVAGFGLYRADGSSLALTGSAPATVELPEPSLPRGVAVPAVFRMHPDRGTLSMIRWIGLSMGRGDRRFGGPRMMSRMPMTEGPQLLFIELRTGEQWTRRALYPLARIAAPLLILGALAGVGVLYRRTSRYRRRLAEQEQLARLGEASRTLSHEIKNPLSAILMQTGLLRRTLPPERAGELQVIEEEVDRLRLLTDRIGDFIRDPRGQPEPVDVAAFVGELALRFGPRVSVAPVEGPPPRALVDRQRLRSVLENLVNNALESDPAASGPVEIAVAERKGRAEIVVRDRGPGIPADRLGDVFDPFFTTKATGSGIGLAVVRRFAEAAGGSISLANRPGGGLEATVTLPWGSL